MLRVMTNGSVTKFKHFTLPTHVETLASHKYLTFNEQYHIFITHETKVNDIKRYSILSFLDIIDFTKDVKKSTVFVGQPSFN